MPDTEISYSSILRDSLPQQILNKWLIAEYEFRKQGCCLWTSWLKQSVSPMCLTYSVLRVVNNQMYLATDSCWIIVAFTINQTLLNCHFISINVLLLFCYKWSASLHPWQECLLYGKYSCANYIWNIWLANRDIRENHVAKQMRKYKQLLWPLSYYNWQLKEIEKQKVGVGRTIALKRNIYYYRCYAATTTGAVQLPLQVLCSYRFICLYLTDKIVI